MSDAVHVVHLVRRGNPLASLDRFLDSYRAHDAGRDHRLVLLCKGFEGPDQLAPVLERLDGLRAQRIDVPDDGYDLTAYRRAAERLGGGVECYLNSHSVLRSAGWLEALVGSLSPGVGIVGATGSWFSAHSHARQLLGIPGAHGTPVSDRGSYRAQSGRLTDGGAAANPPDARSRPPLRQLRTAAVLGGHLVWFAPFPARHVRTNAFVIRADTMTRLRFPALRTKMRAWRLESGRGSITEQVEAMGLDALVAGRDGRAYRPSEWPESDTFWQADQGNLLVADNQTERYRVADLELRTFLSRAAWGSQARPAAPS